MIENIKVSPSILDSFCNYLTGKYNTSEQDVIERINKTKQWKQTEAMQKGTIFHALTAVSPNALYFPPHPFEFDPIKEVFRAEWFEFPEELTGRIIEQRSGYFHEQYVSRPIPCKYGDVLLYGYVDDVGRNHVQDLKTGNYYQVQYEDACQWRTYLYCTKAQRFTYLITDFTNIYYEEYFNHAGVEVFLQSKINLYVDFLNDNADKINHDFVTVKK